METNTGIKGEDMSSRFQVLERPTVYPGNCACCGAVDRPVVDFGVEIDYERQGYGALLLCVFCCKQAASKFPDEAPKEALDLVSREELENFKRELTEDVSEFISAYVSAVDGAVAFYGSPDSVLEQAKSKDATDDIVVKSDDESSSSAVVIEANRASGGPGTISLSSNSSDGFFDDGLGFFRDV